MVAHVLLVACPGVPPLSQVGMWRYLGPVWPGAQRVSRRRTVQPMPVPVVGLAGSPVLPFVAAERFAAATATGPVVSVGGGALLSPGWVPPADSMAIVFMGGSDWAGQGLAAAVPVLQALAAAGVPFRTVTVTGQDGPGPPGAQKSNLTPSSISRRRIASAYRSDGRGARAVSSRMYTIP